jgi:hypothetical protein
MSWICLQARPGRPSQQCSPGATKRHTSSVVSKAWKPGMSVGGAQTCGMNTLPVMLLRSPVRYA